MFNHSPSLDRRPATSTPWDKGRGDSTAEMVYGATLRLPGELIIPTHSDALRDPLSYVDTLKDLMHQLQYQPPRSPSNRSPFVPTDLNTCTHVYIRNDAVKPSLHPTYQGSAERVIARAANRTDTVSIDRLKPAYSMNISDQSAEQSHPSYPPTPTPTHTRSGRRVKFPDRLSHTISFR